MESLVVPSAFKRNTVKGTALAFGLETARPALKCSGPFTAIGKRNDVAVPTDCAPTAPVTSVAGTTLGTVVGTLLSKRLKMFNGPVVVTFAHITFTVVVAF